ncbi:DUF3078 domain-containing protein [Robiginitalea aurantiaca]|uniref:DUF3078 domain-containing protein n=1 Tax=Robiginitalea aurantiaca TaxID=3056915 RepID=A0ABT7WAW2_9FLAO|nr:DUF3078 domain-containing protein [Robiginitalea aurantiaca]MDM9630058.1 DUF3078 domain-containing protein [Robiginitalea aurantiaca]
MWKVTDYLPVWVILVMLWNPFSALGQETLPDQARDTSQIDTIVIRAEQTPIVIIPRGVSLTNPRISFNQSKPLTKRQKKFRVPSFWEIINEFDLQLSEVAFVNWNAGGDNAVSALGKFLFERNYKFRYFQWDNSLEMRFGWNAQEGRQWRKTDDAIRLSSTLGYRNDTISNWYYSAKANFNTQFANGYKYPDRSSPISRFMAPGYLFMGGGVSYIMEEKVFNLYLSPLTFKSTFVLDEDLANQGAFGVQPAVLDAAGNVIVPGEKLYEELGILITHKWEFLLAKNITYNHNLALYTDYINNFGNIDIDWQVTLKFKVNEFISATLLAHVIYDDDILFDRVVGDDGTVLDPGVPRIQLRQQLGIGVTYRF